MFKRRQTKSIYHAIVDKADTWKKSKNELDYMQGLRLVSLNHRVKHQGLTGKIIPIRMESLEAAKALNVTADLFYLDEAHDTKSVYNDISALHPHLSENDVMCGDWGWASVQAGVLNAAKALNKIAHGQKLLVV